MRVLTCITTLHNMWLVLLAAIICVGGGWIALKLYRRARVRSGLQQSGWLFLASIAAGSSVWCTPFIAMLAYSSEAPVTYEPILTMVSLLVAIAGSVVSIRLALDPRQHNCFFGGALLGCPVAFMHYIGMLA